MPILASEAFYNVKAKNFSNKMLPSVSIELLNLWFQVQQSPFWTNLAFTCKTETLGYLYSHALLIPTKSKNQWFMNRSLKISQVANARLTQKGECWNQRLIRGQVQYWGRGNIFHRIFLFSFSKTSDSDIGILPNSVFKNSIVALRDWVSVVGC